MNRSAKSESGHMNTMEGNEMKTGKDNKQAQTIGQKIRADVLAKYEGSGDTCVRNGVRHWDEQYGESLRDEPLGELVRQIASSEMQALAVSYHQADIDENVAIERVRQAKVERNAAGVRFQAGLARHEGIYAQDEEMSILISRMEVRRIDKDALNKEVGRKVVEFAKLLAGGSEVDLARMSEGKLPEGFRALRLLGSFTKDMVEFMRDNGADGAAIVRRVCDDDGFAKYLLDEKRGPGCLLFLALTALNNQRTKISNELTQGGRQMGFGSAA